MRVIVELITNHFGAAVLVQVGILGLLSFYLWRPKHIKPAEWVYNPAVKANRVQSVEHEIEQFLSEDEPSTVFHPKLHRVLYPQSEKVRN